MKLTVVLFAGIQGTDGTKSAAAYTTAERGARGDTARATW